MERESNMTRGYCRGAARILGAAGLAITILAVTVGTPAVAQFVCGDTSGSGQGASAAGTSTNFACGQSSNAGGTSTIGNTATGASANASGDSSGNVANGSSASASGTRS